MEPIRRRRLISIKHDCENDDKGYDDFLKKYSNELNIKPQTGTLALLLLLSGLFVVAILATNFPRILNNDRSIAKGLGRNLRLITVYPFTVASRVHEVEGMTQLLVTDKNRDVVNAIQKNIGMENNLKYSRIRKKKKHGLIGMLLESVNFISSMGHSHDDEILGEVSLEAFGLERMRDYLTARGSRCSRDDGSNSTSENLALWSFNELTAPMKNASGHAGMTDEKWSQVVNIFVLCHLLNDDSRGYVAHGTSFNSFSTGSYFHELFESALLKGSGVVVENPVASDLLQAGESVWVHKSPIFILPQWCEDKISNPHAEIGNVIRTLFARATSINSPNEYRHSMLDFTEEDLRRLVSRRWWSKERSGARAWIVLETIAKPSDTYAESDARWLARHCGVRSRKLDSDCIFIIYPR